MLTVLVVLSVLLGFCYGDRLIDAEVTFPYDDYTTVHPEGYAIHGTAESTYFGATGYNLGDINGDGLDDLIFQSYHNSSTGSAVVVFGDDSSGKTSMTVGDAATSPKGFTISSDISGIHFGKGFAAGDYNKDGNMDIVITAIGSGSFGVAILIWGPEDNTWSDIVASYSMDASVGIIFTPQSTDHSFGYFATHLGDFNNDSYDDFAVSAHYAEVGSNTNAGKAYVVFGSDDLQSGELNSTNNLELTGTGVTSLLGCDLSTGDFNQDSIPDLIVSAYGTSVTRSYGGRVYVILGNSSHTQGTMDMTEFAVGSTSGLYIDGDKDFRFLGQTVDGRCDINGDGFDDVVIGAASSDSNGPGIAVVVLGRSSGYEALDVATLTSTNGFVITGEEFGEPGAFDGKVGCLGFVNDDEFADFYVRHFYDDETQAVTVLYGQADNSDTTSIERQPYTNEVYNAYLAFNGGSHLGEGNTSLVFTNSKLRTNSGSAFIFEDFTSNFATDSPSLAPTTSPSTSPTGNPTSSPTAYPTGSPTHSPSMPPTTSPSTSPTDSPSTSPSSSPTDAPSSSPTTTPTASPSLSPTTSPSRSPTASPTSNPSVSPTVSPTMNPSVSPTVSPTEYPSTSPTVRPTMYPSTSPTVSPTAYPSTSPTVSPTMYPSVSPTLIPTATPSESPTSAPTTETQTLAGSGESNGTETGVIVGSVFGAAALAALAGVTVYFVVGKKRSSDGLNVLEEWGAGNTNETMPSTA